MTQATRLEMFIDAQEEVTRLGDELKELKELIKSTKSEPERNRLLINIQPMQELHSELTVNHNTELGALLEQTTLTVSSQKDMDAITFLKKIHGWKHGSVILDDCRMSSSLKKDIIRALKKLRIHFRR